jgi:[acyl-carrier-protein] S-malonyltransferase
VADRYNSPPFLRLKDYQFMSLVFVFPGQASQSIGMMSSLAKVSSVITTTFAEASGVLGYDLWQRCQEGPAELLNSTECTQPAMLTAGVATYRLWRERGGAAPAMMAGHSLGEFSALVAADYLDFKTAVDLVKYRGELMQEAVPSGQGGIAAILGLEDADVEAACQEAAQGEIVEAVNFNAPGQVVIAGLATAVARAIEIATAKGARRAMALPMSVPAHSSLMQPAAEKLRIKLAGTAFAERSAVKVYGVDCKIHSGAADIRSGLVKQLSTPVYCAGATQIIECGPGKVLTALNRRVDKNRDLKMLALEDPQNLDDALAAVA